MLALDDPALAGVVVGALMSADLKLVEVTFRSPRAAEVLEVIAQESELIVGAGTVTRPGQVGVALDAGASFIVSPGLSTEVVKECARLAVPVIPGVSSPTEIMAAIDLGLSLLKFFPAEQLGGVGMLRALSPVFPDITFVPTGGIGLSNMAEYLALPSVGAVGGSWMFAKDAIARGDQAPLTSLIESARRAAAAVSTAGGDGVARGA